MSKKINRFIFPINLLIKSFSYSIAILTLLVVW